MNKKFFKNKIKGFTLVEIIVSLGIFSLVMVVAMGAFLKIVDINKRAQSIKTAVNNLSFTMETMSRELRTGRGYVTSGGNDTLTFIAKTIEQGGSTCDVIYSYKFETISGVGVIKKTQTDTSGGSCPSSLPTYQVVTSENVDIDEASFVAGESSGGNQPYVLIKMMGTVGDVEKAKTTFNIQTFINQRL